MLLNAKELYSIATRKHSSYRKSVCIFPWLHWHIFPSFCEARWFSLSVGDYGLHINYILDGVYLHLLVVDGPCSTCGQRITRELQTICRFSVWKHPNRRAHGGIVDYSVGGFLDVVQPLFRTSLLVRQYEPRNEHHVKCLTSYYCLSLAC